MDKELKKICLNFFKVCKVLWFTVSSIFTLFVICAFIFYEDNDILVFLGSGFTYNTECKYLSAYFDEHNKIQIDDIIEYDYNDTYIIASQFLSDKTSIYCSSPRYRNYDDGINCMYYWIVDKRNDSIYGPLTRPKYVAISDSLNINLDLLKK